jgi:hypothetical protein
MGPLGSLIASLGYSCTLRLMSSIAAPSGFEGSEEGFRMRSANTSARQLGLYPLASPDNIENCE